MAKKDCYLLNKYNYPFNFTDERVDRWYLRICLDYCPMEDACVSDLKKGMRAYHKEKLEAVNVPCPKCEKLKGWQVKVEDGLECLYCGKVVWHCKPEKRKTQGREVKE